MAYVKKVYRYVVDLVKAHPVIAACVLIGAVVFFVLK
jgi:hypothetical protein